MLDKLKLKRFVQQVFDDLEISHQKKSQELTSFSLERDVKRAACKIIKTRMGDIDKIYKKRVFNEIFSNGPLTEILNDNLVTEILINQHDSIWYEKSGEFLRLDDQFVTTETYYSFIQRVCQNMGKKFDLNQPHTDGRWKKFRVHIISPPISHEVHISLRHHPKNSWSLDSLKESGWCNNECKEILSHLVSSKKNVLVAGITGSGKTSVISALLNEVSPKERVVILEDVDEIQPPNPISLKLLTREDLNHRMKSYTLSDLVKQSLRMRPQRLVMGELRGKEAKDLLLMLSTGHKGSMTTLHASSAKEALLRLEILVQMGAPHWNLNTIRHLIRTSLHAVVLVHQLKEKRFLQSISQISCLEKQGLILETIYQHPKECN